MKPPNFHIANKFIISFSNVLSGLLKTCKHTSLTLKMYCTMFRYDWFFVIVEQAPRNQNHLSNDYNEKLYSHLNEFLHEDGQTRGLNLQNRKIPFDWFPWTTIVLFSWHFSFWNHISRKTFSVALIEKILYLKLLP